MKTIKLVFALMIATVSCAQVRFGEKEYFNASFMIDPVATWKEKSPNITTELELVEYWGYVKIGIQVLPDLEGGYFDYAGGFGINLTSGYFEEVRYYGGVRLGTIFRGDERYPLTGIEGGIDFSLNEKTSLRFRATGDHREDMLFSGADPKMIYSGSVGIIRKF